MSIFARRHIDLDLVAIVAMPAGIAADGCQVAIWPPGQAAIRTRISAIVGYFPAILAISELFYRKARKSDKGIWIGPRKAPVSVPFRQFLSETGEMQECTKEWPWRNG